MNVNLDVVREEMLTTIYGVMPTPMLRNLTNLTSKGKACFLLSGMKCNFTRMAIHILCNIIFHL